MRQSIVNAARFGDGMFWPERRDKFCTKPPGQTIAREDIVRGPAEFGCQALPFGKKHFGGPSRLIVAKARGSVRPIVFEFG